MNLGDAPAPSGRIPAWLLWAFRLAVLAVLAAYILHGLDFGKVAETMVKLPPHIFAYALVLQIFGQSLQALRWKVMLRDRSIRFLDCLAFISVGSSLNIVSPSGILSDGTISYWMGKRNKMVVQSMSTLLASRLIGVGAMAVLFVIAFPSHLWVFRKISFAWAPAKALFAVMALLSIATIAFLARRHRKRVLDLLHQALPALRAPKALAAALALSVGIQSCQFLILYLGFRAMDIPVAYLDILFFAPIMTFIGMVPMSIGGIGVRESLSIFFFTLLPGVHKEQLLAHAGYGYVLIAMMAAVNLVFAFAVLGKPGSAKAGDGTGDSKGKGAEGPQGIGRAKE